MIAKSLTPVCKKAAAQVYFLVYLRKTRKNLAQISTSAQYMAELISLSSNHGSLFRLKVLKMGNTLFLQRFEELPMHGRIVTKERKDAPNRIYSKQEKAFDLN